MPPFESQDNAPGNEAEGRLASQHPVIKHAMGGKLVLAPIDFSSKDMKILDSGTYDGTWLLDLHSSLASASPERYHDYIGTDLSPDHFPASAPPSMSFTAQNILSAWPTSFNSTFDLVHQRLVLAGTGSATQAAVDALCDLVAPGGWIQLIEAEEICADDDGPAMRQFLALLGEVFDRFGTDTEFPGKLGGWLEDKGMVQVESCLAPMCLGKKCTDEGLREQSVISTCTAVGGLVEHVKTWPEGAKCMSAEELNTFVERLQEELTTQGAYYPMRVVWGQKPDAGS